ncbi:hypothetical protein ABLE93_20645 [Xanthobacter sp. KR7-65]|uniref:hypothetical protein n=1 Tax=Xanthobacter sp. KR7-65 TaxID=3156612 RepID=UPI0032B3E6F6
MRTSILAHIGAATLLRRLAAREEARCEEALARVGTALVIVRRTDRNDPLPAA